MDETASTANLAGKKCQPVAPAGARFVFWVMPGILFSLFIVLTALLLRASAMGITLLLARLFGDAATPATLFAPTHGGHFVAAMAGQALSYVLLITCVPALLIAGLIGVFGARWMGSDVAAAKRADDMMSTMRAQASYVGRE